jgi:hypothetical protein
MPDEIKDRGQVRAMWQWARELDCDNLLWREFCRPIEVETGVSADFDADVGAGAHRRAEVESRGCGRIEKVKGMEKMSPLLSKPLLPSLTVQSPRSGSQINKDGPLNVVGIATGQGGAEPVLVESVTVRIGNQPPVTAQTKIIHPSSVPTWSFQAALQVNVPSGPVSITVQATLTKGGPLTKTVLVVASGPGNPLFSTFIANVTLMTTNPNAGSFSEMMLPIGTMFSGDRESIVITDFPPITDTVQIAPGVSDTVTVALIGGGVGTFDPSQIPRESGAMSMPIDLLFQHSDSSFGDSKLSVILSTGSQQSPKGTFHDTGVRMFSDGSITLIADGEFFDGFFDQNEASLKAVGIFSPVPFPGELKEPGLQTTT